MSEALDKATSSNSVQVSESLEKLRSKDLIIEQLTNECRQLKLTAKNQEASITYFKRKIDELNDMLEHEKASKSEITLP